MDQHELLTLYDTHLRIELDQPGVRREVSPRPPAAPRLVRCIKPAPGMNYVAYSRLEEQEIDRVIDDQIAYFAPLDQPFSWHVCDHDWPPTLKDRLLAHGFAPDDDPDAVMVLDAQSTPDASPALLGAVAAGQRADVRAITPDRLEVVAQIEAQIWGGNFDWLTRRLGEHLAVPDYLNVYVAYVDDQPACASWVYFHPHSPFAGLFGGATLPAYRQRGLYTALLAVRVQAAMRRGYRFLITGASPMSQPILAHNGFRLLTHLYAYEWQGKREQ
ncbi:MAG: GNAT family N-acetyltransferase [Anaerolineae bacterium]